jgi:pyruvate carboxylase
MADPKNVNHVALFMPGVIQSVDVKIGQKIQKGDVLYSINSMKMVTAFKASEQHEGKIVEHIYVSAGMELQISADGTPLVIALKNA